MKMNKPLLILGMFVAVNVTAQDLAVVPKTTTPVASQPQANVAVTPEGGIVIVPMKAGVIIPVQPLTKEEGEKLRAEMKQRKAERAARSKAVSGSSSSSTKAQ
jgi:hypothetical protein